MLCLHVGSENLRGDVDYDKPWIQVDIYLPISLRVPLIRYLPFQQPQK
jgi:hypothetical protein